MVWQQTMIKEIVSLLVVYKSTLSVLLWLADLFQNALFLDFRFFKKSVSISGLL